MRAVSWFQQYRQIAVNVLLLAAILTGLLATADVLRSFALGMAAGLVLINLGTGTMKRRNGLQAGNRSVKG